MLWSLTLFTFHRKPHHCGMYIPLCADELRFVWNMLFCTCKRSLFLASPRYLAEGGRNCNPASNITCRSCISFNHLISPMSPYSNIATSSCDNSRFILVFKIKMFYAGVQGETRDASRAWQRATLLFLGKMSCEPRNFFPVVKCHPPTFFISNSVNICLYQNPYFVLWVPFLKTTGLRGPTFEILDASRRDLWYCISMRNYTIESEI